MRTIRLSLLIFITFLFVTGCRSRAFTDPWVYAPKNSYYIWTPDEGDQKKIDRVEPLGELEIPNPEDRLALGDLFDISLRNSPKTARSWQEARESAASYAESLSPYLPSLSFTADVTKERSGSVFSNTLQMTETTYYGPEVALNYLIWDFGTRSSNAEYYFQTLQQMNFAHNESIQSVMQTVASTYYNYLYAKELLVALNEDLLNAEQTYQAASEKVLSGIYNETEKMQARTNYLQKKVQVTGQEANVENSFVDLLSVLGIPCNVSFQLGSFPSTPPIDPFDVEPDVLVQWAKSRRPDYQGVKAMVLAKEASLKNAKAQILPQIQLSATGGGTWYSEGLTDNGNYSVGLALTFPIFSGFYYLNQIRQAEAALKTSVSNLRSSELALIREVKTAHNTFVMAKSQLVDTKNYLESAEVEFKAMLSRYKSGVVTILDLLSSQAFLSDARAYYVRAQKTYYMAIIDIAFATGLLTTCPWNVEAK